MILDGLFMIFTFLGVLEFLLALKKVWTKRSSDFIVLNFATIFGLHKLHLALHQVLHHILDHVPDHLPHFDLYFLF